MRADDQQPESQNGQRSRIPMPPPTDWETGPTTKPMTRREREAMMRQVRQSGSGIGSAMPPTKPRGNAGQKVMGAIAISLIAVLCFASGYILRLLGNINPHSEGGAFSLIGSITNPLGEFPGKKRITILMIGQDVNHVISKKNRELNGMPTSKDSRSDSIMLATLDLEKRTVGLLSIPRDTYVNVHVRNADGIVHKINGTYLDGPQKLAQTIADVYGVMPDYYVVVKISGFPKIVDALGGVEVETIDAMRYDDEWGNLHVNLPKGKQIVNGQQAIGFARFREADTVQRDENGRAIRDREGNPLPKRRQDIVHSAEEGDPRRMARQQQLIKAMATKAKSFSNLFQLDKIVNVSLDQVDTNLTRRQIFAIASLFRTVQPDAIESGTMPGEGGLRGRTWYFIPDKEKVRYMVDWLVNGNEEASYKVTTVSVQNATSVSGAAETAAKHLESVGFDVENGGNAPRNPNNAEAGQTTRIIYEKAATLPRAKKVAELLGGGTLVKDTRPDATGAMRTKDQVPDITVVLGADLAGKR